MIIKGIHEEIDTLLSGVRDTSSLSITTTLFLSEMHKNIHVQFVSSFYFNIRIKYMEGYSQKVSPNYF